MNYNLEWPNRDTVTRNGYMSLLPVSMVMRARIRHSYGSINSCHHLAAVCLLLLIKNRTESDPTSSITASGNDGDTEYQDSTRDLPDTKNHAA